jgi:penicillin-binding protein 1A
VPFQPPVGIKLIPVDPRTGQRASPGGRSITEAFKPGTAPPDNYSSAAGVESAGVTPEADRAVRGGGLY